MSYARQMLDTYAHHSRIDAGVLATAIDALSDCVQACTADVDADLSEVDLADMVKCVRLCLHCTDVCAATLGVVSRPAEYDANLTRPLRLGLSAARPNTTPISPDRWLRPVWRSARAAEMSVSGMPKCTRTAGCARRPAGVANKLAASSWPP